LKVEREEEGELGFLILRTWGAAVLRPYMTELADGWLRRIESGAGFIDH